MSLERLWAGWRSRYVNGVDDARVSSEGPGTLFERILADPSGDEAAGVVHRGPLVSVMLNAFPYGSGHVLVMPNRGVARLSELSAAESAELWQTVEQAVAVLEAEYRPGGVNVGLNQGRAAGAGVPDHLHVHVLPRWDGDTNFTTTVAETRVLPESLDVTWERLVTAWSTTAHRNDGADQ